jgi:hypothetical protein
VQIDGTAETRIATLDPAEILAEPRLPSALGRGGAERGAARVGVSRELSMLLVALFAAELGVRLFRRWSRRRPTASQVIPNP